MYMKNKWCRRIVQLIGVSDYVRVWYLYPVVITLTFCMLVGYCKWTLGIIHVIVIVILPFLSCHDHACRCPKRARLNNFMLLFNCLFVTLKDIYNVSLKTISEYQIQKKNIHLLRHLIYLRCKWHLLHHIFSSWFESYFKI